MKKLLMVAVAASLVMSSTAVYAADTAIVGKTGVDVVAAATGTTPAPTTPTTPAKPTTPTTPAKPATPTTKPATPAVPATPTKPAETAKPAANVEITRTLRLGSKGDDVKALQTMLNDNGYKLVADGKFGKQTATAVKGFQAKNKLTVDGIVGPKTIEKLTAGNTNTITKANDSIKDKTVKGDVYVKAENFQLINAKVEGTVYFTTQKAKDTFKMTNSTITGKQILADVDAVSTASITHDAAAFKKALSKDGAWIICPLRDLTFTEELVVEGTFHDKNDPAKDLKRKIGLYTHNDPADKKKATHSFTLTAPKLTIKSPSTTLQYGYFVGDIYVYADNFNLTNIKVTGNIYFATQSAKDTFTMVNSTVTGKQILADVDVVSTASITHDAAAFKKALGKDGAWIVCPLRDLTFTEELVVEGTFHDKNDPAKDLKRKIGLYTHNDPADKKKATHSFTLTAPKMTVKSPNTTLQYGFYVGDIWVESDNFNLTNIKVTGDIYFTTQSAKDTFTMVNSTVTGEQVLIQTDAVASASLVGDAAAFEKGISKDGAWITSIYRDVTTDKELVVDGVFKNKEVQTRKIALYSQDDKRNITRKFTLTAPKMTVMSPDAKIQGGIFKGDLYVSAPNFQLAKAKVDGNIYFMTQEAKDTFKMDADSSVTGEQVLIQTDAVASASLVGDAAAFEKGISKDGAWITSIYRDVTTDKELVVDGVFKNKEVQTRKIALYSQDDKRNITRKFTLTAPKMTIKSPDAKIQGGIFKGDLYVSAPNFQLAKAKVDGNIYFTTQEAKDTFKMDADSSVTGKQELKLN